jgi:hypothetical protein
MARRKTISIDRVAAKLVGGKPLATHRRPDGTLVVIGPAGRKRTFTSKQVQQVRRAERQTGGESEDGK